MERVKSRLVVGLAAFALAGGVLVAAGPPAGAATEQCGSSCATLITANYGSSYVMNMSPGRRLGVGSEIDLAGPGQLASEDFLLEYEGTVAEFYADGLVPAAVGQTWPSYPVYEYLYAPDHNETSLCVGLASNAANGTDVTLQTCGVNDHTLWIPMASRASNGWEPLIAGSDTLVTNPYVLMAGNPGAPLTTQELTQGVTPSQYWENVYGVL
jgi:hypothetical protein